MKTFLLRLLLRPVPGWLCFLVIWPFGGCLIAMYACLLGVMPKSASDGTPSVSVRVYSINPLPYEEALPWPPNAKLSLVGPFLGMQPVEVVYDVLYLRAQGSCLEWRRATSGSVQLAPGSVRGPSEKRDAYALFALDRPELAATDQSLSGYRALQRIWSVTGALAQQGGITVTRSFVEQQELRHLRRTVRARVSFCREP